MTEPIEPLKELARRWRNSCVDALELAGETLESLLPALEAAFASHEPLIELAHRMAKDVEVAKLEAEIAALNKRINNLNDDIELQCEHERLERAAALREAADRIESQIAGWQARIDGGSYANDKTLLHAAAIRLDEGKDIKGFVLALIPPADAKALDAYVQERVDAKVGEYQEALQWAMHRLHWESLNKEGFGRYPDRYKEVHDLAYAANRAKVGDGES